MAARRALLRREGRWTYVPPRLRSSLEGAQIIVPAPPDIRDRARTDGAAIGIAVGADDVFVIGPDFDDDDYSTAVDLLTAADTARKLAKVQRRLAPFLD